MKDRKNKRCRSEETQGPGATREVILENYKKLIEINERYLDNQVASNKDSPLQSFIGTSRNLDSQISAEMGSEHTDGFNGAFCDSLGGLEEKKIYVSSALEEVRKQKELIDSANAKFNLEQSPFGPKHRKNILRCDSPYKTSTKQLKDESKKISGAMRGFMNQAGATLRAIEAQKAQVLAAAGPDLNCKSNAEDKCKFLLVCKAKFCGQAAYNRCLTQGSLPRKLSE